jgi:hypothetical protein
MAVKQTKDDLGNPVENAVHAQAFEVAKYLHEAEPTLTERGASSANSRSSPRAMIGAGKINLLTR